MTFTTLKRWTAKEYDAMLEHGILTEDDRVELVDGQIIQMSPQNPPHASATKRSYDYLKSLLPTSMAVRSQLPILLASSSEPESDIAVVISDESEYSEYHPILENVLLIIEISDATITFDLGDKATTYAKAGIADYWVVDVRRKQVHILRQPVDGKYTQKKVFTTIDAKSCEVMLALPDVSIFLINLLPLG